MSHTYRDAGVDVEKAEKFAKLVKSMVVRPKWVREERAGYAAVLEFTEPPIAVTVDGIGTKLVLHREFGTWKEAADRSFGGREESQRFRETVGLHRQGSYLQSVDANLRHYAIQLYLCGQSLNES